jgi:spectrin beta
MHHQQQQFLQIEVVDRVAQMRDGVELIKALKVIRSRRINESLQSQEYYAEASEAELWIRERIPLASRGLELCNNQSSAEAYLRRLDALEQEIKTFSEQIRNLKESCNRMTDADHFDLTQLTARQAQLEEMFHQMSVRCKTGKVQVENVIQYFNFVRHVDDLISWMIEKKQLADREDYGTDLEDCVELIEQFEQVIRELAGSGERVSSVLKLQVALLCYVLFSD